MPPSNTKNRFDKKDSLKLGEKAEEVFILSAVRQGWKVSASSRDENIDEHWDYLIEKDVTSFKVEVKSGKRIQRKDGKSQHEFVWVEIRNVRGKVGWLFGKSDLIAFESEKSFFFVKRIDLLKVVNKKVDLVAKVKSATEALYKIYTREGRQDRVTLLPVSDIEPVKFMEWKK